MSQFMVELTRQPAEQSWGEQSRLTFVENVAKIHVESTLPELDKIRVVQKAARQLESFAIPMVSLTGDWSAEEQWAFAQSYTTPARQHHFTWCDDDSKSTLEKRYEALVFTRQLVNETPEELSPQNLAGRALNWLEKIGGGNISSRQWVGSELAEAGWTGIYNVGRGSVRPPVLLEVDYNPSGDPEAPVSAALVGKGITFDSGGYSIKSSEGMLDMKCDMGGAATVTGGLGLAILNNLQRRVKLYLCCAENLISGHAYKLGDVLTYKNGISVEIVNTDAEGRLVLADGLLAAGETNAPLIIDAATLTGAAVMAVGNDYNALFGLDGEVQQKIINWAESENELVWPLPLEKWHQEKCPSHFADTANSRPQKGGGAGGASNAAGFLSRFVPNNGAGWVHMDLAAAYNGTGAGLLPAGASGLGIRTIAKALLNS